MTRLQTTRLRHAMSRLSPGAASRVHPQGTQDGDLLQFRVLSFGLEHRKTLPVLITVPVRLAGNRLVEDLMKLKTMLRFLGRFVRAQEAVSALEYAIIVGVVVAGVGGALAAFTGDVEDAIEGIATDVATTTNTVGTGNLAAGNNDLGL